MLYLVGTPIGNLEDISLRAIKTLQECDAIFCEDTKHTLILLNFLNIFHKKLYSFHKFNEKQMIEKIIHKLQNNENLVLVSDAGMPCITDPGFCLLQKLKDLNLSYTVIPGACALLNALLLSGYETSNFVFLGFLPESLKEKIVLLNNYKYLKTRIIIYVAVHDLIKILNFLYQILGQQEYALVKEITKIHEGVEFSFLKSENTLATTAKGEYVLVINNIPLNNLLKLSFEEHLNYYLKMYPLGKRDIIKIVLQERKANQKCTLLEQQELSIENYKNSVQ